MLSRRHVLALIGAAASVSAAPHSSVRFIAKPKALPAGAVTHDWKTFLGPTGDGHSTETKLLRDLPPKLVWEFRKGTGYSSPAISGNTLVYFHRQGSEERVEALHPETAEKLWDFAYTTAFEDRYGYNNGPRSSPVMDADRVYTYGAEGKLHCLNLATGKLIWKRDMRADFKVPQDFFGTASSPLIEANRLILNVGAPNGGACVAAFDKLTGKTLWSGPAGPDWGPSYSTPVAANIHGKRRILVLAGGESKPPTGGLVVVDPASGAVDCTFPWRSRSYESVNASSPVAIGNQVFVSASYRTGGAMVSLQPDGKCKQVWTSMEIGTHFTTAIHQGGYLYAFDGRNEPDASLVCVEAATGKVAWRETLEWQEELKLQDGTSRKQPMSPYRGTLMAVDGRFLCLGEMGHLLWLDLSPKGCKVMSRTWLVAARETWSLPVLSRGLLYVSQHSRDLLAGTQPRLLCYDLRGSSQ